MSEKGIHDGHKKRLRDKFSKTNDFSNFYDHEILEMFLGAVNVRKNTNEVAHDLLKKFGSYHEVFEASRKELMAVKGIGERTATYILMQKAFFEAYEQRRYDVSKKRYNKESMISYVTSLFTTKSNEEHLYMICIKSNGKILEPILLQEGSISCVQIDQRDIIKHALLCDACAVIFAHNHITGSSYPSNDDIESTVYLRNSLSLIGISIFDHFVVSNGECTSIADDPRFKFHKANKS